VLGPEPEVPELAEEEALPEPAEPLEPAVAEVPEVDLEGFDELFEEWQRTGRPELRDRLIGMHMNLVRYLARKFRDRGEPLEDLIQQGTLGLINAVDRFDLSRGVKFSTYATPTILGEIRRYFRDKGWSMKVPRKLQELNLLAGKAIDELTHELDRSPTIGEIASTVGASQEEVIEALEMAQAYALVSLDAEVGRTREDSGTALHEYLGAPDEELLQVYDRQELVAAMSVLDERERRVVDYAYREQMSQTEIAKILGISQMHVSRIQRKALTKMREHLRAQEGH
jgi:RNA polymerase sigma-B factor